MRVVDVKLPCCCTVCVEPWNISGVLHFAVQELLLVEGTALFWPKPFVSLGDTKVMDGLILEGKDDGKSNKVWLRVCGPSFASAALPGPHPNAAA